MNEIQLTAEDGCLHLFGEMLLCIYDAGDCDRVNWPMAEGDEERLLNALFVARECDDRIPYSCSCVLLPDGRVFYF